MERYTIKLTIDGLMGTFAEKYSRRIDDAQLLHRLMIEKGPRKTPVDLLAPREAPAYFDAYTLFSPIMKLLRRAAHDDAQTRFFTGVRFEPTGADPSPWAERVRGQDDAGAFEVVAFGTRAVVRREGPQAPTEEDISTLEPVVLVVPEGTYRCRFDTWENLFRQQLDDLVTMCEEAMAKDQKLIATTIAGS